VDGVVDWVSPTDLWDPKVDDPATRGGRAVAIIGQDGVRYYGSHLLDVAPALDVGVRVTAGDPIGHVDSSGNARGVSPHLHFGISHPTTPGDWKVRRGEIGPFGYLNAWKTGRALTPVVPGARAPLCSPAR
jgi:murein DD-endopeptidase MepM/ murein hydrolase activator NlpD